MLLTDEEGNDRREIKRSNEQREAGTSSGATVRDPDQRSVYGPEGLYIIGTCLWSRENGSCLTREKAAAGWE